MCRYDAIGLQKQPLEDVAAELIQSLYVVVVASPSCDVTWYHIATIHHYRTECGKSLLSLQVGRTSQIIGLRAVSLKHKTISFAEENRYVVLSTNVEEAASSRLKSGVGVSGDSRWWKRTITTCSSAFGRREEGQEATGFIDNLLKETFFS